MTTKALTICIDSIESASTFMDDICDLIYYNDREKDVEDRHFQGPDNSEQIGFSWDGVTFCSANDADRHIRQERYGNRGEVKGKVTLTA